MTCARARARAFCPSAQPNGLFLLLDAKPGGGGARSFAWVGAQWKHAALPSGGDAGDDDVAAAVRSTCAEAAAASRDDDDALRAALGQDGGGATHGGAAAWAGGIEVARDGREPDEFWSLFEDGY